MCAPAAAQTILIIPAARGRQHGRNAGMLLIVNVRRLMTPSEATWPELLVLLFPFPLCPKMHKFLSNVVERSISLERKLLVIPIIYDTATNNAYKIVIRRIR